MMLMALLMSHLTASVSLDIAKEVLDSRLYQLTKVLTSSGCTNVVIARNTVRNGHNAAISLFLSCRNVLITENVVWLYEDIEDQIGLGCKHHHALTH